MKMSIDNEWIAMKVSRCVDIYIQREIERDTEREREIDRYRCMPSC